MCHRQAGWQVVFCDKMWKSVTKCHNVHQCDKWLNVQTLRHNVQVTIGANRWASKWPGNPIPGQMGKAKWEESRQGNTGSQLYLHVLWFIWSNWSLWHWNVSKLIDTKCNVVDFYCQNIKYFKFYLTHHGFLKVFFDRKTFCGPWFMAKFNPLSNIVINTI